jgi:thiol:disulfide interchange protein DsbD
VLETLSQTSASVVRATPVLSVDKVRQGSAFQAAVVLDIQGGYHINSSRPSDPDLIATALKLDKLEKFTFGAVTYPRGQSRRFSFSPTPLSVYEGRVILKFSGRAAGSANLGKTTVLGKLTLQACDDRVCLPPRTVEVEIPVEVVPPGATTTAINTEIFRPRRR